MVETDEDDPREQGKAELNKIDINKDGFGDLSELTLYMRNEIMEPEETEGLNDEQIHKKAVEDAEEYLSELDGNKDGFLSLEELEVNYREQLTDMDSWQSEDEEADDEDL